MSRFFVPITEDELKAKIEAVGDFHDLVNYLDKDIKVDFDLENFSDSKDRFGPKEIMGYNTLENGLTYLGCCAGGDWENPVYFIVYFDGKKLRGYIPTKGNVFNTTTKQAYGNDLELDKDNLIKKYGVNHTGDVEDEDIDPKLIIEDVTARILPLPKPEAKKSHKERIESLKYYGTGDEGYELFCSTCSLAYQLGGFGNTDKETEYLVKMAESQAKESLKWYKKEGNDPKDENADFETGCWGRC